MAKFDIKKDPGDAKTYLIQIRQLQSQIDYKTEELEIIQSKLEPQAVSFEEKVNSGMSGARTEKLLCKLIDYKNDINEEIYKLMELKLEAMTLIDKLTSKYPNDAEVLHKRYVQGKKWEEIAEEMFFSVQSVYKIHGRALQKFQNILNSRVK